MNLKPGMKQAMLLVDNGQFEMYNSIAEAREYLKRNIDWIIHTYGSAHWIGKEDVIIVSPDCRPDRVKLICAGRRHSVRSQLYHDRVQFCASYYSHIQCARHAGRWAAVGHMVCQSRRVLAVKGIQARLPSRLSIVCESRKFCRWSHDSC